MSQKISKFAIYGERSSGTNFLERSIKTNFHLEITHDLGHKHFFCFDDCTKTKSDNTLFICIVRNPIYWIHSFFKKPYHVPNHNKKNIQNFLFNEFYSVHDEIKQEPKVWRLNGNILFNTPKRISKQPKINTKDLNYVNGKKYKNIFELRKNKNHYLMNILPKKVKNCILINYEDLLYNFVETMDLIKTQFNLKQRHSKYFKSDKYKQSTTQQFKPKNNIAFSPALVEIMWNNLDANQENKLGYFKGDANNRFKNKKSI